MNAPVVMVMVMIMTKVKTTEQIQSELDALQVELNTVNSRYSEIDGLKKKLSDEQKELLNRHTALVDRDVWGNTGRGLIGKVNLELIESKSPIYERIDTNGCYSGRVTRIISVDKKWIELKCDGQSLDSSIKYNRETVWRMRSRDDYGAIDAQKALAIWNEFNGVGL